MPSTGGSGPLRRRSAQYDSTAGSSGDALSLTNWCRTISTQENLRRLAPLTRSGTPTVPSWPC